MNQPEIRPPIVTVMGHIDHGKTSLLDKIRTTNIWRRESGGITQHIGAYQAVINVDGKDRLITFIDTPGHAAFEKMRQRGAQVTDLVVLVIAASEGVMIQTKECLEHIKKAGVPFIVALNKIDLDNANPDKVKGQLTELGYTPEEYGGTIPIIPVSAKTGQGVKELLEMIVLNADMLEIKSSPRADVLAYVIESKVDKRRGPVASVVVKQGTIKTGDQLYSAARSFKIKAMLDYLGNNLKSAPPSTPVEILGFTELPEVGSLISTLPAVHPPAPAPVPARTPTDTPAESAVLPADLPPAAAVNANKRLPVIIKADTQGTLQALLDSFSDDVHLIHTGVGPVSDNDIFLAESAPAQIFAFNLKSPSFIHKLAENRGVIIFESQIIYEIIEEIQKQVLKILEPTIDENILGEGKIIAEFQINKSRIAGVQVTKGKISTGDTIHLKRDSEIIKDTKVGSLRRGKEEIASVNMGNDCGISFKPYVDFKLNDVILSYNKMGKA